MNNPSTQSFCLCSYVISSSLSCKSPGVYTYLLQLGELSIRLVSLRTVICLRTICRACFAAISLFFTSLKRKSNFRNKGYTVLNTRQHLQQGNGTVLLLSALRKHRACTGCAIHGQGHGPKESQRYLELPHN